MSSKVHLFPFQVGTLYHVKKFFSTTQVLNPFSCNFLILVFPIWLFKSPAIYFVREPNGGLYCFPKWIPNCLNTYYRIAHYFPTDLKSTILFHILNSHMKETCFYYFLPHPANWFVYSCVRTTQEYYCLIECLNTYKESKSFLMLKKHIFLFLKVWLWMCIKLHQMFLRHLLAMVTFF